MQSFMIVIGFYKESDIGALVFRPALNLTPKYTRRMFIFYTSCPYSDTSQANADP
jgi:hypothetical protein